MNYAADIDIKKHKDISKVRIDDPDYPLKLKRIKDPPKVLYYKGRLPDDDMPSVAIIGARTCSSYGSSTAKEIAGSLAGHNIQIISGMAYGIDGIAQSTALSYGAYSAGVLGCGVDVIYPPKNKGLYENLIQNGCVISEYVPGTMPKPSLFPRRNRIIAGLCDVLIVIEARKKSGTLITTDYALEQGKDIYAVPGRINDPLSAGCLSLIEQGAYVVTSIDELMSDLSSKFGFDNSSNILPSIASAGDSAFTSSEQLIYNVLDSDPRTISDISFLTGLSILEISQAIVSLELSDCVSQISKGYYVRSKLK